MFLQFVHIKAQTTVLCYLAFDLEPRHLTSALSRFLIRQSIEDANTSTGGWGRHTEVGNTVFIYVNNMVPVFAASKLKYLNNYGIDGTVMHDPQTSSLYVSFQKYNNVHIIVWHKIW